MLMIYLRSLLVGLPTTPHNNRAGVALPDLLIVARQSPRRVDLVVDVASRRVTIEPGRR
jgi:hypothetical protein